MPDLLRRAVLILLVFLALAGIVGAAQPVQVADLNTRADNGSGLAATEMLDVDGVLYFVARDAAHGRELWRSQGTSGTTRLVRDICPGPCDSSPGQLAELDGDLYFFASDGVTGRELWRTDGTVAKTLLVRDICPGMCSSVSEVSYFERVPLSTPLVRVGGTLLFDAYPGGLWRTDGTRAGTRPLTDQRPYSRIAGLISNGSLAFFRAESSGQGVEPWRSDGTAEGTSLIQDLCPGPCWSGDQNDGWLTTSGDDLLAWRIAPAPQGGFCRELLRSASGVSALSPIGEVCGKSDEPPPRLVEHDGAWYFGFDKQLWRADSSGIALLFTFSDTPAELTRLSAKIYFAASSGSSGRELWATDGTAVGTYRVRDIQPGAGSSYPESLTAMGGRVCFVVGGELWVSDGTENGTVRLMETTGISGPGDHQPANLTAVNQRLFFTAERTDAGRELWITNGTPSDTYQVRDIYADPGSADPRGLRPFRGTVLFGARDDATGGVAHSLYASDGTAAGTVLLRELAGEPLLGTQMGDDYFVATNSSLWVTDGTASGTRRFQPHLQVIDLFNAEGRLLLGARPRAVGDETGVELWASDGTAAGTTLVKDIRPGLETGLSPGPLSSWPEDFVRLGPPGSPVLFTATTSQEGTELWRTDGTADGTFLVKDLYPGSGSSPSNLTALGPAALFTAYGPGADQTLWRSDGTTAGTLRIAGGLDFSLPLDLTAFQERIFFFMPDQQGRDLLWKSDGTPQGTVRVQEVAPAGLPRGGHQPVVAGDQLFFTAWSDDAGQELWVSDGASVRQVADILPGPASSSPRSLTAVGRFVLFAADDGSTGSELWVSDGTAAGTYRVQDLAPGPDSSAPSEITVADGHIFFAATSSEGRELWSLPSIAAITPCVPGPDRLCLAGGRFEVAVRWRDHHNGGLAGTGHAVPESLESGFFWFFDPANLELVVKVLDGREINGRWWVFFGALTDVEYEVTVTDHETGQVRTYRNPAGTFCGQADTAGFPGEDEKVVEPGFELLNASAMELPPPQESTGPCLPGAESLCLFGGRFHVEARWKTGTSEGQAGAVPRTDATGSFWFFDPANVELFVKVLDGRPLGGKIWFFYGALSDVEYWIIVTDMQTGAVKTYHNPPGTYCGKADTKAF